MDIPMRYKQSIAAATVAILIGAYVFYLRMPSNDWMTPTVEGSDQVRVGQTVRVNFKVRSNRDCTLDLTRYMEQRTSTGVVLYPVLKFERKVIKSQDEVRNSFFAVVIPEAPPGQYRLFSRIKDDCSWLDRIWPRVVDTTPVEITVVP